MLATDIGEGFSPKTADCFADKFIGSFDSPGDMMVALNLDELATASETCAA